MTDPVVPTFSEPKLTLWIQDCVIVDNWHTKMHTVTAGSYCITPLAGVESMVNLQLHTFNLTCMVAISLAAGVRRGARALRPSTQMLVDIQGAVFGDRPVMLGHMPGIAAAPPTGTSE